LIGLLFSSVVLFTVICGCLHGEYRKAYNAAVCDVVANCRKSLGMHSGAIPDSAITASSSYDSASVGPSNGRSDLLAAVAAALLLRPR